MTCIDSTIGVGRPHDSSRWRLLGSRTASAISAGEMNVVGKPDSVWPNAWHTTGPRRSTASTIFSGANGDAAAIRYFSDDRSALASAGCASIM